MTGKKKKKPTARVSRPGGSKLSKPELREFKTLLSRLRDKLRRSVDRMENDALSKGGAQGAGELSTMPLHMADVGTDTFEQDMTLGRIESEADELEQVEAALDRISRGLYGLCESCRKPIPKLRLRAIPYAVLCIDCKQKEEKVS
jgi:RNA polymerase-binding transcription factor DksA